MNLPGWKELSEIILGTEDAAWRYAAVAIAAVCVIVSILVGIAGIGYGIFGGKAIWEASTKAGDVWAAKATSSTQTVNPATQTIPVSPEIKKAEPSYGQTLRDEGFRSDGVAGVYDRYIRSVSHPGKSIQEWDLRLLNDQIEVAAVHLINVHSDCAWEYGSAKRFANFPTAYCPLQTILKDKIYRERLALGRHVVLVGLDSFASDGVDTDGQPISAKRASALAILVDRVHPSLRKVDRTFWTLDLGRSKIPAVRYELPEFQQRSVVILAIELKDATLKMRDIVRLVTTSSTLGTVDLSTYDKSAIAKPLRVKGMGGLLPVSWTRT